MRRKNPLKGTFTRASFDDAVATGGKVIRMLQAKAWDAGFTACAQQHMQQDQDPTHPITRTNPYEVQS